MLPNLAWVDQTACTVACIMETLNPSDSVKQSQQTTLYVCFNNVHFRDYSGFKICDSKNLIWLKCVRDFLKLVKDLAHYFWGDLSTIRSFSAKKRANLSNSCPKIFPDICYIPQCVFPSIPLISL